jgi:AraC-like DNA-binding protein
VTVDGRTFTAEAGDIYLLPIGSEHEYRSDARDPWEKVWVNVHGPLADALLDAYGLRDVHHVPGLDLGDLFDALLAVGRAAGGNADALLPEAALLLHRMLERIHAHVRRGGAVFPPEVATLKDWLDGRTYERADMRELAGRIYRSPSHMTRIFKRSLGITPYEYLVRRRLETAKSLLLNTTIPIKEIAYRLEFADEHYFSNVFRKRTDTSPSRFRAERGGGGNEGGEAGGRRAGRPPTPAT